MKDFCGIRLFLLAGFCSVLGVVFGGPSNLAQAANVPDCMDSGHALPIDNAKVLHLKGTTPNGALFRAHVKGTVTKIYSDRNGHIHFQITIGARANETLEVVYNESFGGLPEIQLGMSVQACGDYITSNVDARYPASPDLAIIHWVHFSPSNRHESGFLVIDDVLYGMGRNRRDGKGRFRSRNDMEGLEEAILREMEDVGREPTGCSPELTDLIDPSKTP